MLVTVRIRRIAVGIVVALVGSALAFAEEATRVGYVDIDRVTAKAAKVRDVMDKIQDQVKGIQEEIDRKLKELGDLTAEVRKNEGVLSKDEMEKKRKELTRRQNELEDLNNQGKSKMTRVQDETMDPILKSILYSVEDVAKERKIDLVLRGEAVLYGTKATDLTDDVIAKLGGDGTTTGSRRTAKSTSSSGSGSSASSLLGGRNDGTSRLTHPLSSQDTPERETISEPSRDAGSATVRGSSTSGSVLPVVSDTPAPSPTAATEAISTPMTEATRSTRESESAKQTPEAAPTAEPVTTPVETRASVEPTATPKASPTKKASTRKSETSTRTTPKPSPTRGSRPVDRQPD